MARFIHEVADKALEALLTGKKKSILLAPWTAPDLPKEGDVLAVVSGAGKADFTITEVSALPLGAPGEKIPLILLASVDRERRCCVWECPERAQAGFGFCRPCFNFLSGDMLETNCAAYRLVTAVSSRTGNRSETLLAARILKIRDGANVGLGALSAHRSETQDPEIAKLYKLLTELFTALRDAAEVG